MSNQKQSLNRRPYSYDLLRKQFTESGIIVEKPFQHMAKYTKQSIESHRLLSKNPQLTYNTTTAISVPSYRISTKNNDDSYQNLNPKLQRNTSKINQDKQKQGLKESNVKPGYHKCELILLHNSRLNLLQQLKQFLKKQNGQLLKLEHVRP